jgi:hypothetical protein
MEVREQLGTALNGELVLLVQDIPEQDLRHFGDSFLLHTKLGDQDG